MSDSLEEDKDGVPTHVHTGGTKIMIYEDSSNDDEPNFKVEGVQRVGKSPSGRRRL